MTFADWLINPSGLTPHGFCLSWAPGLVALHAVSDGSIALAYFFISYEIASFIRRRPDRHYSFIALLFMAFITTCGVTHAFSVLTLWVPAYGVEGLVKAVTAALAVATAALLWPMIPRLAALPSTGELERLNGELALRAEETLRTAALLRSSEGQLRTVNADLERRVAERTSELEAVNAALRNALQEKTAMQAAIERSELEFRASFESAVVGKLQCSPRDGRITRVNQAFARMLGYEVEEMLGRPEWDFVPQAERALEASDFERMVAEPDGRRIAEKRYLRRSGESFWGRVSAAVVRTGLGDPSLVVCVVEDVDERHRALEALEETKIALESALADRTAALAQRDLLLREVYHRVKNNLQIIDSMLVMQSRDLMDPLARDAFRDLRNRIYALGLVHQQLMGSEDLETFDVAPFLTELTKNILDSASGEGIDLTVASPPLDVGLDFGIPLGLLVTELVTNSLKHGFPNGRGRISVSLERGAEGSVVLVVADNGVGLEMNARPRAPKVETLGSKIIDGLVRQMGGKLSTVGEDGVRTMVLFDRASAA